MVEILGRLMNQLRVNLQLLRRLSFALLLLLLAPLFLSGKTVTAAENSSIDSTALNSARMESVSVAQTVSEQKVIAQEVIEQEVMAVLDEFMATFSARDPAAHTTTYHFPHYRLARGEMNRWENQVEAIADHKKIFQQLPATGWAKSRWVDRTIITASEKKVHVNTRFERLRADGSRLGVYTSLYVLIKREGRWGIVLRSSFL
jgi:hypothetical protein